MSVSVACRHVCGVSPCLCLWRVAMSVVVECRYVYGGLMTSGARPSSHWTAGESSEGKRRERAEGGGGVKHQRS